MLSNNKSSIILLAIFSCILVMCEIKTSPENVPEWQTVFFDDFNRNDGPVGSNYSVTLYIPSVAITDTLSISNNILQLTGELYYAIKYMNEVNNDVIRVSAKFSTSAAPSSDYAFGVCARSKYQDPPNYQLVDAYCGFVAMDTDSIGIYKVIGGNLNLSDPIIAKAFDVKENRTYLIELTVNQLDLTFVVNDLTTGTSETLNFKDNNSPLTGGGVSINGMLGGEDVIYIDDFKIEKYE